MNDKSLKTLFDRMGQHWGNGEFAQAFAILEQIATQVPREEIADRILVNDMTATEIFRKLIEVSLYRYVNESPAKGFLSMVASRMIQNQNQDDWFMVGESLKTCLLGMEAEVIKRRPAAALETRGGKI